MKVNLRIEEDDQFRHEVRSLIEGQVRHILREQLAGIVAGEIAKMRLLQPNSPMLAALIVKEIQKMFSTRSGTLENIFSKEIQAQLRKILSPPPAP
jgi:transposase